MLIITTQDGLEKAIASALSKLGVAPNGQVEEVSEKAEELPTRRVREILKQKGYRVISDPAFNTLMDTYKVRHRTRGKERWWQVADVERIPARV